MKNIILAAALVLFAAQANAFCVNGYVPDPNNIGRCIPPPKPYNGSDKDRYGETPTRPRTINDSGRGSRSISK